MNVIEAGNYQYLPNTRTIQTSEDAIYQALIEMYLEFNKWPYAPNKGFNFDQFKLAKQSQQNTESFEKQVILYLAKYGPVVTSLVVQRLNAVLNLNINNQGTV